MISRFSSLHLYDELLKISLKLLISNAPLVLLALSHIQLT